MRHSKSSLFLMELIIAILFFSLASTVCIQLFAKSHLLSKKTVNQNQSVIWAQNLAESYFAMEGNLAEMAALFNHCIHDDSQDTLQLSFDKDWNACLETQAVYQAKLISYPVNENGLISANIEIFSITEEDTPIYTLAISHHIAERRGDIE